MTTANMDPLGAELAFGEGCSLLAAGQVDEAVVELTRAVHARPDQAAYHAWLGWALWRARGEDGRCGGRAIGWTTRWPSIPTRPRPTR